MPSALRPISSTTSGAPPRSSSRRSATPNGSLLTQLLPVIDDLKLALANVPAELAEQAWPQGVALIGQKLDRILERQGLEQIGGEGDRFDPHIHEAVAYEEHPVYDEGQVASVYRIGYRLNDRVLRPAQVVVARGSSRPPASAGGDPGRSAKGPRTREATLRVTSVQH